MLISELMTKSVEWTTPNTTLTEAARRMRDRNIGCLPVGAANSFTGILTEKDLTTRATAEGIDPTNTTVQTIMTTSVTYCQDTDSVEDALRTMETRKIHHLPVRNASNNIVGIVSLSDLALRGPKNLYDGISKLAFQNASNTKGTTNTTSLPN